MSDPLMPLPTRQGLVARIQGILLKPSETWDIIAAEPSSIQSIFMGYVVPLAAIGPICRAIGMSVFGVGAFGFSYHTPWLWSIITAVVSYVLSLVMVYVMAFIIDALAPNFDGQKSMLNAFKLSAYSATAGYLAGVFGLIPMLGFLGLIAIYGIYIFYIGLPKLMKNPQEKSVVYMVVIAVCAIIMSVIIGMIAGGVTALGGGAAMMGAGGIAANGGGGTFTFHGKDGSASVNLNQMAAAASQMAAQASAIQQNGTAASAGPVKIADAQALLGLTPAIFNGATRADTSTSSGGAGGIAASTAEATYSVGGGSIHLKVSDIGSMAGIGAFANAMNVNASSSSGTGYEITKTEGNRMSTERYDTANKSGEYTVVLNGRVSVEADGSNVDMATMKALVSQVDLGKADALTH